MKCKIISGYHKETGEEKQLYASMSITHPMKDFEDLEKRIDGLIEKREFNKALEIIEEKIEESSDIKLISFLLYKKATVEFFKEKHGEAIKDISRALSVLSDVEDEYFKGEIMFHLAALFSLMGDFENGVKLYERVLEIFPENHYFYLSALNNLGEIHKRRGNIEESMKYFKNSYENSIKNKELKVAGYTCESLAELYVIKRDEKMAREYLEKALSIAEKISDDRFLNLVRLSLAIMDGEERAIREYADKLKEKSYTHDVADSFYIFSNLADEKLRRKLLKEAIFLYSETGDKYMEREAIRSLEGD